MVLCLLVDADFSQDLQNIIDFYKADPKCTFNSSELTSKTIQLFPQCNVVYGIIIINSNTDLSEFQLKNSFRNMETFAGGIRIENAKLAEMSIFQTDINFQCGAYGFFIKNNSYLYDATMLLNMNLQSGSKNKECVLSVDNNPELDMDELCSNGNLLDLVGIRTEGNLRNCEFILFYENQFVFNNLHANLCEVDGDIEGKLLCRFTSMYDLPNNCDIIVGNVTIRRGDEEYVIKFVDVKYLFGSLTIVNTTLETLEYAGVPYVAVLDGGERVEIQLYNKDGKKLDTYFLLAIFCWSPVENEETLPDGVIIQNNTKLTNAGALDKLVSFIDEDMNDCKFQITNNPILDLQNLCDGYALAYLVDFETYGNLKNCGCQGNAIYPSTLLGFQNCTYFYNGLRLYNFSDTPDLKSLSKIGTIYGNIDIQNSNLQNLSFLENFQYSTVFSKNEEVVFNIQNNPNMTRLDLPALKNMDNSNSNAVKIANFENLHPDFCLTISEFWLFYELEVSFKNLHAKLCEYSEAEVTEIEDEELCIFESLDKLPDACKTIVGNILIESGDEKNAEKLMFVGSLFGSLTIRDTNLADLKFLSKLNFIVFLDDNKNVIEIVFNENLKDPRIGGKTFTNVFTRSFEDRYAFIQYNHPDIWNSTNGECNLFGVVEDDKVMYRTSLNYTGGDCGPRMDNKSTSRNIIASLILVITFSLEH
ncbi:hypothetical protein B9Z55_017869 [Caenorhabditis nigoni]|nr:hypothetical protein B9Z55_017869 [Caenorhabditis nigoni]